MPLLSIYFNVINGSPTKEFKMERGLRQGDPLSPFLFLIAGEELQVLTTEACNKGIFKGVSLANDGANLFLLQYADDTLLIGEWSISNAVNLVRILSCFQDMSGLKINISKSKVYGVGVDIMEVEYLARVIKCSFYKLPFIYLGLPVGSKMHKVEAWNKVVDRVSHRLSYRKARLLSIGGRFTLTKAVQGSLPLYFLSILKAPVSVINRLESLRSRFFFGF